MNSEKWVFNISFLVFLFFGLCNSTSDTITPNQPIKDGVLLVSNGEIFALGFFSPGNGTSNHRYVGIWYYKISEQTVVWVANQDNPINGKSGVISINQDETLSSTTTTIPIMLLGRQIFQQQLHQGKWFVARISLP
ncbi:hypothetical protein ACSBR1_038100 [Camellia fascicularis]